MASTTSFKQQCPSCEAMVPIRDPNLIGRKIDCPKCKYRFVVEKPKGQPKGDDDENAADKTPAPAKKAKKADDRVAADARVPAKKGLKPGAAGKSDKVAAGKPKAKPARPRDEDDEEDERPRKKKKQGGVSTTVLIGAGIGGLALVLLVIGILGFTLHWFGGGDSTPSNDSNNKPGGSTGAPQQAGNPGGAPNKPGPNNPHGPGGAFISDVTNLLPNDADTVVNYQIDKLRNSGLGQAALTPGAFSEQAFADLYGFPLYAEGGRGVERVLTAINNSNNWVFAVLHTQKGLVIDRDKLIAGLGLEAHDPVNGLTPYSVRRDLDGLSNLLIKANRSHDDLQMVMLDGQTLVFADPAPMKKFLSDVKEFKGHPEFKTQPTVLAPANPGGGPNPGGSAPPGASSGGSVPPMPGGSAQPSGSSGGPGGSVPPMPGGSAQPSGSSGGSIPPGGSGQAGPRPGQAAEIGSYLTINPDMKAVFDRIERSDRPILISAVTSSKDPLVVQLSTLVQGRAASWATAKDVGSDEQTRSVLDTVKAFRPQDENASWIGFSLTACSSDKLSGAVVLNLGTPDLAKPLYEELQLFVPIANALLTGAPGGANPGSSNPNPGGSIGPGGSNPGGSFGPGGSIPPMPMGNPNAGGSSFGPGGSIPPMPMGNPNPGGSIGPGGTNPGGPQGPPALMLTQDKALVEIDAALLFSGEKNKNRADQEIGQLITRLKVGAESASSRSRIHELAAALQRYVQKNGHFPRGTIKRELTAERFVEWGPDQRVSWMAELLPYLGDSELANLPVDGEHASWNEGNNLRFASVMVPLYISHADPSAPVLIHYPGVPVDVAVTNYVGVAGAGLDAAYYPTGNAKDGVFGYDRETKAEDVKKGTIVLLQIPAAKTPWMAGGGATVRGVSEGADALQPFVGAEYQGRHGTFAVMGDFTVRFIPENTDPARFVTMCTLAGGAKVDDLDTIAPVVPDDNPVLKAGGPDGGPPAPSPAPAAEAGKAGLSAGWSEYTSKDGGYTINLPPYKFQDNAGVVKTPVGGIPRHIYSATIANDTAMYGVGYADYPAAPAPDKMEATLDGAQAGGIEPGEKLTNVTKITLDGNPGRELLLDEGNHGREKVRMYLVKNRLYMIVAGGLPDKISDKDIQSFLDSFKLTTGDAPAVPQAAPGKDPAPASADPMKSDMDKFQGAWKEQKEFGRNGEEAKMNFVDKWEFHGQQAVKVEGRDRKQFTFKLDPTQKPATIDVIDADGKALPGIYEFDGDLLKMSFDQHGNKGRPTAFDKITIIKIFGRDNP